MNRMTFVVVVNVLGAGIPATARVLHVKLDAAGAQDGTSWTDAYPQLQSALDAAAGGDQIWVAAGTYRPAGPSGPRSAAFRITRGVSLYGGFPSHGGTLAERNPRSHQTTLSGDLAGDDLPLFQNRDDNSYHVVVNGATAQPCILDGLRIVGGNANGSTRSEKDGGAIFNGDGCDLQITGCVLEDSFCSSKGGAIYNGHTASLQLKRSLLRGNRAVDTAGGVYTHYDSRLLAVGCTFLDNIADVGAGATKDTIGASCHYESCIFAGNKGWTAGATEYFARADFADCLFVDNTASGMRPDTAGGGGGALWCAWGMPEVSGCVFWRNMAPVGAHVSVFEPKDRSDLSYALIQGLRNGIAATVFKSSVDPNVELGAQVLDNEPLLAANYRLSESSPCIGAGDPLVDGAQGQPDIDGEPRVAGSRVDLGPDEWWDSDLDGLPDWWEVLYPTATESHQDADGDGLNHLTEYTLYGGSPDAKPLFADAGSGSDQYDGLAAVPDGNHGPKRSIQAAIDVAGDGDTIVVLPGTYSPPNSNGLDYRGKSICVRSRSGPQSTIIDCGSAGLAIAPDSVSSGSGVLEGFSLLNGGGQKAGVLALSRSRMKILNCRIAASDTGSGASGLLVNLSTPLIGDLALRGTASPALDRPAGVLSFSNVQLLGKMALETGDLVLRSTWIDGPGCIDVAKGARLAIADNVDTVSTMIRTNISGQGKIEVESNAELVLGGDAVLDLGKDGTCAPDQDEAGQLTVRGRLVIEGRAAIRNTNVQVKLLELGARQEIVNNNITLVETTSGHGGELFAQDSATIACNTIISEGDRYLDLDPDPSQRNWKVLDNRFFVRIKEGVVGNQGTLLECRNQDHDCAGVCPSGVFPLAASPGYSDPWVLEELEVLPNAKVNLTNRQGFVFQDPTVQTPEAVYVKTVKLHPGAVLNTALQRLYFQRLVDESDNLLDPANLPEDRRIVDEPLLGFSLGVIAMNDETEFSVRVRKRIVDPSDPQPPPQIPSDHVGAVDHLSSEAVLKELPSLIQAGGVMSLRTQAPQRQSASSAAAKGAFARAGDESVVVTFEYLFREADAHTRLNVYLSDRPDMGPAGGPDPQMIRGYLATLRPPPPGAPGSAGSGQFATFWGKFPRPAGMKCVRGTYIELELQGTGSRVWIDDFDPQIWCEQCTSFDGDQHTSDNDYIVLMSEASRSTGLGKYCLDLHRDGYLDSADLAAWETDYKVALTSCLTETAACCLPDGSCVDETQARCVAAQGSFHNNVPTCRNYEGCQGSSPPPELTGPTVAGQQSGSARESLRVLGKPNTIFTDSSQRIYGVSPTGVIGSAAAPDCTGLGPHGSACMYALARILLGPNGRVYLVHGAYGVFEADTGAPLIIPAFGKPFDEMLVDVGIDDAGYSVPLTDVAFRPGEAEAEHLYVVPVTVRPAEGPAFKAAAKLRRTDLSDFEVVALYGRNYNDPQAEGACANCQSPLGECAQSCDFSGAKEIEVDVAGNVYVAGGTSLNSNDWVRSFANDGTERARCRMQQKVAGTTLPIPRNPSALTVSRSGRELYLTSAVSADGSLNSWLYKFSIDSNSADLNWVGAVRIQGPAPLSCPPVGSVPCDSGYNASITAIQEGPTGELYVLGFTSPRFSDTLDPSKLRQYGMFTTAMVAVVPGSVTWSQDANELAHVLAQPVSGGMAWPISAAYVPRLVADFDDDGDVDPFDVKHLQGCASGSTVPQQANECLNADLDADGDVDQNDFGTLQRCFGSSMISPAIECLE